MTQYARMVVSSCHHYPSLDKEICIRERHKCGTNPKF